MGYIGCDIPIDILVIKFINLSNVDSFLRITLIDIGILLLFCLKMYSLKMEINYILIIYNNKIRVGVIILLNHIVIINNDVICYHNL